MKKPRINDSDLWKKWVGNPEAISKGEKVVWLELQSIIHDLLLELRSNGKIELSFTKSEINHLKKLLKNRNEMVFVFNKIMDTTDSWKKAKSFVKTIEGFGFNDVNYVYLLVELAILLVITDTETFKTLLLFHLKDVMSYKVSDFVQIMKKFAPISWKKLEPFINNKFRNALAHGTWAIENSQVVLFENAKLIPFEKFELIDFLIKTKEQNLLFACLLSVISEKMVNGFFS